MKFEIAIEPMASPRPRFSSKGGFVKAYMPKEYMAWKSQLLFKWKLLKLKQEVSGKPLFVKLGFYLEPPVALSKVKKNQAALEAGSLFASESIRKKLLRKAIDNLREIDFIRYSLNPQIPEPWASMTADEIIKGLGVR